MTNNKIIKMINEQIAKEFFSAYLYLEIANYYAEEGLEGFSNWFEIQAKEELDHGMLFRKYLLNEGLHVSLDTIAAPKTKFAQFNEALKVSLSHEQMITASINEIYAQALEDKDYKTVQFLDWFVKEQGEEEKNAADLIKKFELFGNDTKGMYLLNAELAARVYTMPSLVL